VAAMSLRAATGLAEAAAAIRVRGTIGSHMRRCAPPRI
jgi:hypothetical protein